ncbi:MAG TPA: DUF3667 domain-containing protein [Chitinophagaceae bacterium]|jgi:hypothetical protein|nr:DUF3667 domain-containing protein [Chitinophagaceae bacterium]
MQEPGCLNCGGILLPNQDFCPVCGQKANTKRLTLRELGYDFLQVFINTEKGILRLLKGLTLNPGRVGTEYIEGRRKTYFNPFTFMALCIAFQVLFNGWLKPYGDLPVVDPVVEARIRDQEIKEKYLLTVKRSAGLQDFVNKNLNTASVAAAPFYALFLWLFFKRRNRNFAEIIVAYLLFTAFSNILSTLLFSPWLAYYRGEPPYYYIMCTSFVLQTAYIAWGMKGFYHLKGSGGYIKMLAALSLIGVIGFILLIAGFFIFVYHGAYEVFRYL